MEKIASLYWRNSLFMKKGCKVKSFICLLVIAFLSICVSNAFAASKPEFTIKIGTPNIDGVKDADIENKCTVFELTERIDAVGPLDKDSNYIVYVCYDKNNIYFACDADDDVVISSDIAEADYRDSDYIRFYIATEEDFEGITVFTKNHYAFVWTPQDKDAKWNLQVREASKTSYGGIGHAKLDGDAVAEFINSKSGPTDNGWYIEASIGWDVLGIKKDEKELLGRIVGIMFISGDTDKDNEGGRFKSVRARYVCPVIKLLPGDIGIHRIISVWQSLRMANLLLNQLVS